MELEEVWPPFALRIRCGDMELSPVRESDYSELADIADGGVRQHNLPAFLVNWDSGTREEIARSMAQYQWNTRANFQVNDWTIEFTVRVGSRVVGVQGVSAQHFPHTRSVSTGSWLALHEQGQGYGTRMRRIAVTAFADHFDAVSFHSGFFEGNEASRKVSERLGYSPNGVKTIVAQDGLAHVERQVILTAANIERGPDPVEVVGAEQVRRFLGLELSRG
ncbi:Protein N-acetyltransferase, RimJ/RimL family [Brevibacterium sandarakinum]|uniref:Protein N-acetyltransferase, RimJ/RimL family n=2 Tax=Brevibacterium sandarakinum TaxID=629680 RepID=A0A1H1M6Y4_BRESA|nr:Protein N-acetyltransferase, RimJ/RimL family [Brevibacterium sandarakinum]